MQTRPQWHYHQSAVIPYLEKNGKTSILLITTRKKKKWTLPKGIVEPNLSPEESALQEAYEEAGIEGEIQNGIFGTFQYTKWGGTCHVKVFLMKITQMYDQWEEDSFRDRKSFSPEEAIRVIGRKEMQPVLEKFSCSSIP
jgi:8-oxo-dGTP pyrophosphatase MutT (NUDIX family)